MSDAMHNEEDMQQQQPQIPAGGGGQEYQPPPPPGGQNQPPPQTPPYQRATSGNKSPALAAVLSGMFPGLGHIYVGFMQKGLVLGLLCAGFISMLASGAARGAEPLFGISIGFVWFYGMIDAHRRANLYNLALAGGQVPDMPKDLNLPEGRGSKVGGAILVVIGFLLLLNIHADFAFYWVEDWWPVILIGFGAYLIRKAQKAKRQEG